MITAKELRQVCVNSIAHLGTTSLHDQHCGWCRWCEAADALDAKDREIAALRFDGAADRELMRQQIAALTEQAKSDAHGYRLLDEECERLTAKLDDKDRQIVALTAQLDGQREAIRQTDDLRAENAALTARAEQAEQREAEANAMIRQVRAWLATETR